MEFAPSHILKPFVQKYIAVGIAETIADEIFYPSGHIDLVIRTSGQAATSIDGHFKRTPDIELLGHITSPAKVSAKKGTEIIIARLHPYACSLFFKNPVADFTKAASNLHLTDHTDTRWLSEKIGSQNSVSKKIAVLDRYLVSQLKQWEGRLSTVTKAARLCNYITDHSQAFSIKMVAAATGLSERTIQKQFNECIGLSPVSLFASHRFLKSLNQITNTTASLTSVAYDCGYYDQAHFIKEFKRFTGVSPMQARRTLTQNDDANRRAVNVGL